MASDNLARQPSPVYPPTPQEGLVEICAHLCRKVKLFGSVLAATLLVTGAVILFTTPEYESRLVLSIATPPSRMQPLVPSAALLGKRLREKYDVDNRSKTRRRLPRIERINTFENMVEISVRAHSSEAATKFLFTVSNTIVAEINKPLDKARNLMVEAISRKRQDLEEVRAEIVEISDSMENLKSRDPAIAGFLTVKKAEAHDRLLSIQSEIQSSELELLSIDTNSSTVVHSPQLVREGKPITPRPLRYLLVGALIGIFLGGCVVFLGGFVKSIWQSI